MSVDTRLKGSMELSTTLSLILYAGDKADKYMEASFELEYNPELEISAEIEYQLQLVTLGWVMFGGVIVEVTPSFVVKANGSVSINGTLSTKIGFRITDTKQGIKYDDISEKPTFSAGVKVEGEYYIGLSLEPKVKLLTDWIANVKATAEAGVTIKATLEHKGEIEAGEEKNETEKHDCISCILGETSFDITVKLSGEIFNDNLLDITILKISAPLHDFDFYVSLDHDDEFGFGSCPYRSYKIDFNVSDQTTKQKLEGAEVNVTNEYKTKSGKVMKDDLSGVTDVDGNVSFFLHEGKNAVNVKKNKFSDKDTTLNISVKTDYKPNKDGKDKLVRTLFLNSKETTSYDIKMMPVGYPVHVSVVDDDSKPVSVMKLTNDNPYLKTEIFETDMDGKCTISLPEGTWKITTTETTEYEANSGSITIEENSDDLYLEIIVKHATGLSKFTVHDQFGDPVVGAKVQIENLDQPELVGTIPVTDSEGFYSRHLKEGNYKITISKEGYASITNNFTVENEQEGVALEYEMLSSPVKVNVTVVDKDGKLITNAKVSSNYDDKVYAVSLNGSVNMELPSGEYTITAEAENYTAASQTVKVEKEELNIEIMLADVVNDVMGAVKEVRREYTHSAAITEDGSLYMWGPNKWGQLGNGTVEDSYVPIKIMDNVKTVELGRNFSAAITEDGNLYTWGLNDLCQLGNGTLEDSLTPIKIMDNVKAVDIGKERGAAITEGGSLYMWGFNYRGKPVGTNESSSVPVKILDNVKYVSLESDYSAAITEDGSLYMWGNNKYGQLGNGESGFGNYSLTPIKIMDNVKSVSLEYYYSAAITEDGSLYMWGQNYEGQLGNGTTENSSTPIKIMENVKSISLGTYHSAAITEDGSLYMWGNNSNGQLGNDTKENSCVPIKVMSNIKNVILKDYVSAAITTDSVLYLWGSNQYGRLGDGSTEKSLIPKKIMDNVKTFMLDIYNSIAITEDGSLYMWGVNQYGRLGDGTTKNCFVPIKINNTFNVDSPASAFSLDTVTILSDEEETNKKTADFTNLKPNTIYNFYSMRSRNAENPLSGENLLYISQAVSDKNGNLSVSYIPKEETEESEEFVVNMIYNIGCSDVTVDNLDYTGEEIKPTVTVKHNGNLLEEGTDYQISVPEKAVEPGDYTAIISGLGDYYGNKIVSFTVVCKHKYSDGVCSICGVTCSHEYENGVCTHCGQSESVVTTTTITATTTSTTTTSTMSTNTTTSATTEPIEPIFKLGDVNNDGKIDASDASDVLVEYANLSTGKGGTFTDNQKTAGDVNSDNKIDASDSSLILVFYSYVSTGGKNSIEIFLKEQYSVVE